MKLFVIIPAFNEEGNIERLVADISCVKAADSLKILIVNDGSTDRTAEICAGFSGRPDIGVITHPVNTGIPAVFRDGLTAAAAEAEDDDVLMIVEGDGTSDINLFSAMTGAVRAGSGLVVASRHIPGGAYKNFPFKRLLGSRLVNLFLRLRFRLPGITDYTIFYRAYRAGAVKQALAAYGPAFITVQSFACNLEILLKLRRFCGRMSEVPLVYDYGLKKGGSKMSLFGTLLNILRLSSDLDGNA